MRIKYNRILTVSYLITFLLGFGIGYGTYYYLHQLKLKKFISYGKRDKKLYEALKDFYAGRYEESILLIEDVLSKNPNDPLALKRIGSAYYALGDTEKAIYYWEKYLKHNPTKDRRILSFLKEIKQKNKTILFKTLKDEAKKGPDYNQVLANPNKFQNSLIYWAVVGIKEEKGGCILAHYHGDSRKPVILKGKEEKLKKINYSIGKSNRPQHILGKIVSVEFNRPTIKIIEIKN